MSFPATGPLALLEENPLFKEVLRGVEVELKKANEGESTRTNDGTITIVLDGALPGWVPDAVAKYYRQHDWSISEGRESSTNPFKPLGHILYFSF